MSNFEVERAELLARIEEQAREIERLSAGGAKEYWRGRCMDAEMALKAQPSGVVLPEPFEMRPFQTVDQGSTNYKAGFNAAIRKVRERLNSPPVTDSVVDERAFGTEKGAILFCEARGIDDESPYRDRALDAFVSGAAWQARAELSRIKAGQGEAVAFLDIGAGGYVDLGTDQTIDALEKLPYGRHMLGIIGTYGADGWHPAAQRPLPNAEPVAYAAFAENGNIRVWSRGPGVVEMIAAQGCKAVPLYTSPPSDPGTVPVPIELALRLVPKLDARHWHQWNASEAYQAACELRALLAQSEGVRP